MVYENTKQTPEEAILDFRQVSSSARDWPLRLGQSHLVCANCHSFHLDSWESWNIFEEKVRDKDAFEIDGAWITNINEEWREVEKKIIGEMEGTFCTM